MELEDREVELHDELADTFSELGYPLNEKLVAMLREEQEYRFDPKTFQNNRKGSGFTTAGRYLAEVLHDSRTSPHAKEKLFSADFSSGDVDIPRLRKHVEALPEGQKMLGRIIVDILDPVSPEDHPEIARIPSLTDAPEVGTCTTAELYFLEYARGEARGMMNYIVDAQGEPLMVEKVGAGEDHTSVTLKELVLDGARIPPGSLVYVSYDKKTKPAQSRSPHEGIIRLDACLGFHFLRLMTFAVSPKERLKTFGMHVVFQEREGMRGFATVDMDDFRRRALRMTDVAA